ncbi:hypothetical protein QW180_07650 [Vibrio sinaloensis]|nr:hypothetical protein [Vibrio sinaloensis]
MDSNRLAEARRDALLGYMLKKVTFTVNDCTCGHHFRIKQSFVGKQAMKVTAMTISPIQHRCYRETIRGVFTGFISVFA